MIKIIVALQMFATTMLSGCATRSNLETVAEQQSRADSNLYNSRNAPSLVVVKPISGAVELNHDECQDSYQIISEWSPSSEIGILIPVSDKTKPHWFMGYRCKRSPK